MAGDVMTRQRPIIFSGPMVRAILEGRKTQTRRVVVPRFKHIPGSLELDPDGPGVLAVSSLSGCLALVPSPYGQPGDLLYVRETWRPDASDHLSECVGPEDIMFAATADEADFAISKWRPSIYMPRWVARIWLRVTGVRAEQVQKISEADARAEGTEHYVRDRHPLKPRGLERFRGSMNLPEQRTARRAFRDLWDSINAKRGYDWGTNPLVRRVVFERCEAPT